LDTKTRAPEVNVTTAEAFQESVEAEFGGVECSSNGDRRTQSLDSGEGAEGGAAAGQCSRAAQALVTVLQVLAALVAAGVPRGVPRQSTPVQEQLLLGAFGLTASLRVAAACSAQHPQQGADGHTL